MEKIINKLERNYYRRNIKKINRKNVVIQAFLYLYKIYWRKENIKLYVM